MMEVASKFSTKFVYQKQWNETACGCWKLLINIINNNKTLKATHKIVVRDKSQKETVLSKKETVLSRKEK